MPGEREFFPQKSLWKTYVRMYANNFIETFIYAGLDNKPKDE